MLTIKDNLQRNGFPLLFIDKIIKNYLDGKFSNTEPQDSANKIPPRYYKLPFLGDASILLKNRLSKLVSRCCDNAKVKLIFVPIKLNSFFSLKDVPRASLKSSVVYRFTCAGCSASYVGETSRHLTTRIKEHLETDKNSHVYKHLRQSSQCKDTADANCFSILDSAPSKYQLKIKEGMYISWLNPILNKQVKSLKMSSLV